METEVVKCSLVGCDYEGIRKRVSLRNMSEDEFIENHASGTLRKNKRLQFKYKKQYLHERTAYEFGYPFECVPSSRIVTGDAFTEGDCKSLTEAGWFIERYIDFSIFPEDVFGTRFIQVDEEGTRREGVGLVVRKTSAPFVPHSHLIFAIIAEFDVIKKIWLPAVNPS